MCVGLARSAESVPEERTSERYPEILEDAGNTALGSRSARCVVRDNGDVTLPLQIRHQKEGDNAARCSYRQQTCTVLAPPDYEQAQKNERDESRTRGTQDQRIAHGAGDPSP